MSTEFNPMEGLLADLLSTWDEEPGGELVAEPAVPPAPAVEPAATAVLPFVSALVKPAIREPLFPETPQALAALAVFETKGIEVTSVEPPIPAVPEAAVEGALSFVAAEPEPDPVLTPVWLEDAGAAAACASILARMEREFTRSEPAPLPTRRTRLASDAPRYVVFVAREMLFAVPIERVLETDRVAPITPLPGAAAGVKGLTNLRGEVVPVIDLREVLGWPAPENSAARRMLVIDDGNRQPLAALLVDQVKGLAAIAIQAWKPAEMAGAHGAEGFVDAVAERDQEWVSRLNLDRVLKETHLPSLAAA